MAVLALIASLYPALKGRAEEPQASPLKAGAEPPLKGLREYFSPTLEGGASAPTTQSGVSSSNPISRGNAMLRSLVVPGWGESYLGYHSAARRFFWADVIIWASAIGLETYSKWKQDQFMALGSQHAGAQMSGKSDGFYADIGNYMTTQDYNQAKIRERNFDAMYTDPSYFWSWDSDQNRANYDNTRVQSKSAHNKIIFAIGAAALNRLISFIDTGKKANEVLHRPNAPALGFHLEPGQVNDANSVRLVMTADFR